MELKDLIRVYALNDETSGSGSGSAWKNNGNSAIVTSEWTNLAQKCTIVRCTKQMKLPSFQLVSFLYILYGPFHRGDELNMKKKYIIRSPKLFARSEKWSNIRHSPAMGFAGICSPSASPSNATEKRINKNQRNLSKKQINPSEQS